MAALWCDQANILELCSDSFASLTGSEVLEIHFSKCGEQKKILSIATAPTVCGDCLKFTFTVGCDQDVELSVGLWQFDLLANGEGIHQGRVQVNKIVTSINAKCST